jgi:hypothetical protein
LQRIVTTALKLLVSVGGDTGDMLDAVVADIHSDTSKLPKRPVGVSPGKHLTG